MEKYDVSDWEQRIKDNNESDRNYFDQNMIYKAKIIGNNYEASGFSCRMGKDFLDKESTYELSGLKIKINECKMQGHLDDQIVKTYTVTISEAINPNEPVYISYIKYVPGAWEETFENLFKECIDTNDNEPKVYKINKELPNK